MIQPVVWRDRRTGGTISYTPPRPLSNAEQVEVVRAIDFAMFQIQGILCPQGGEACGLTD